MHGTLRDTLLGVVLLGLFAMVLLDAVVLRWGYEVGRWVRRAGQARWRVHRQKDLA